MKKIEADIIYGLVEVAEFDSGTKIIEINSMKDLEFLDDPFEGRIGFEVSDSIAEDLNMIYGVSKYQEMNIRQENTESVNKKSVWVDIVTTVIAFILIIGFIYGVWFIAQKLPEAEQVPQNRYEAYYGTFTSWSRYYFDSYTVNGNQYIFYDVNGNFVGEIYVSGNNNLSIRSR